MPAAFESRTAIVCTDMAPPRIADPTEVITLRLKRSTMTHYKLAAAAAGKTPRQLLQEMAASNVPRKNLQQA
jgi:hypothetical protein